MKDKRSLVVCCKGNPQIAYELPVSIHTDSENLYITGNDVNVSFSRDNVTSVGKGIILDRIMSIGYILSPVGYEHVYSRGNTEQWEALGRPEYIM